MFPRALSQIRSDNTHTEETTGDSQDLTHHQSTFHHSLTSQTRSYSSPVHLSSLSHLLITQRTYLFAGVGGALFFTGLILTIQKRFNLIGAGIAGCLLLCGMAAQWMQLSHYKSIANKQKVILAGILEAAPRLDSKKRLFIIDRTGSLSNAWMLQGELLGDALTYLYGMKAEPIVCLEPGLLWSSFAGDKFGRLGRCVEQSDTWQIGPELPPSAALAQWWPGRSSSFSIQKNQLTTLIIEPDGQVHKKTPIPSDLPATPNQQARWAKILGCWPAKACHAETLSPLPNHFTFNFGEWWSMDAPIPGAGWQSTQWTPPAWQPGSFAWINQPQSSLLFSLSPHSEPYLLQLNLLKYITEPAKQSLKIVLNGHPLHHHWKDTLHALAKVDPTWLKEGINELLFLTHVDPNQGVSLGVESVKISPLTKKDSDIFQDVMKDLTCQNNFDFTSTGHVNSELLSGFSVPESHGRWTDGDMASFQCYKPKAGDPLPTKVLITAFGFNPDNHVQRAIVTINGAKPIEYLFTAGEQKIIELPIQQDSLNKITINISLPDSIIPNPGDRKLGIAIKSIKFL